MALSLLKIYIYIRLFSKMKATVDDGFIEINSFNSSKRKRDKFVQIFQTHLFAKFKQAQRT